MPIKQSDTMEFAPFQSIVLGARDVGKIQVICDLISGGEKTDQTIIRGLRRFILGRQRPHLMDKLVDYVIAWETILLTQSGTQSHQELSYRFALNGASIISQVRKDLTPNALYKKMRSAYSTRSSIVHGAGDKDINKELKTGEFANLGELCNFLEESFRLTIFWLASKTAKDRPYRQADGWELLIWPRH